LVTLEPHKGAVLRRVTPKFVADIHDTRAAIESLLARRAAERITDDQIVTLEECALLHERAAASGNGDAMSEANRRFHSFIAAVADNPEASYILDQGWELVINLKNRFGLSEDRIAEIVRQHHEIVEAIRSRNEARAVAAVKLHCDSARDDLLARMMVETTAMEGA
jgi:DNA-binding GntR family transcriptional regulator